MSDVWKQIYKSIFFLKLKIINDYKTPRPFWIMLTSANRIIEAPKILLSMQSRPSVGKIKPFKPL